MANIEGPWTEGRIYLRGVIFHLCKDEKNTLLYFGIGAVRVEQAAVLYPLSDFGYSVFPCVLCGALPSQDCP